MIESAALLQKLHGRATRDRTCKFSDNKKIVHVCHLHDSATQKTVVPYPVNRRRKYPTEVWQDISVSDMVNVSSNIMGTACRVHNSTRRPIQPDDEILIAMAQ
jgi:hypothetical protein